MKPPKSKLTEAPDSFPVTDAMKTYAKKIGYVANLEDLTEDFLLYHQKEGSLFKSWDAAWKTWLRNQLKWYPELNVSKNRQPGEVKSHITQAEWQEKYGDRKENIGKVRAILPGLTKKV